MTLKEIRKEKGLTQQQAANILGVSLRTYITYESNESKLSDMKLKFVYQTLEQYGFIDETHGILTLDNIKQICAEVLREFNAEYCYLFGSYAKGTATETSDVDLLVSVPITGIKFYGLIETLREKLKKKVDLLDLNQLENNTPLVKEILKYGIKIYNR